MGSYLETLTAVEAAKSRGVHLSAKIAGVETAYWQYSGVKPEQPSLIFVHGYRGTHAGLEAIAGALPDFNIFIPDLPGYGESGELSSDNTAENLAIWLGDFADAVSSDATVVGHSFGTLIVSMAAADGRLGNRRIVLINPVASVSRTGIDKAALAITKAVYDLAKALGVKLGSALITSHLVVRVMSVMMAKTRDAQLRNWIHNQHDKHFSRFANLSVATQGFESGSESTVNSVAAELNNSTLLILGELDNVTPLAYEYELATQIKNCEYRVIPQVGHLIHYETPLVAAEFIREFENGFLKN